MEVANRLSGINRQRLEPVLRRLLGQDTVEVIDWQLVPIHTGADVASEVYRVCGTVSNGEHAERWSIILKQVRAVPDAHSPSGWHYWKREAFAYTSGLLDNLPAGLSAPRCLHVEDHGAECSRMWLADHANAQAEPWTLADYAWVARQLGRFNGAYLTGERPLPSHPWLSRGWLRGWTEKSAPLIARFPGIGEHPAVRRFLFDGGADAYLRVWRERAGFFDALDRLPQTFCHYDVFPRNMFIQRAAGGDDQPVAIDWAFAGNGALGEDVVPLVIASATFGAVEPSSVIELEQAALAAYTEGLRDAGWHGDPRLVRLGYALSASLRFGPGCAVPALLSVVREDAEEFVRTVFGLPFDQALARWSAVTAHVLNLAAEARISMDALPQTIA